MLETKKIARNGIFMIREFPDPILLQPTKDVKEFDAGLAMLVGTMVKFIGGNAIGLAAPQVGVQKNLFVWQIDEDKPQVIINPRIVEYSQDKHASKEGCLSFPNLEVYILRNDSVVVEGENLHGKTFTKKCTGMHSNLFQHEIDHLEGIVMVNSHRLLGYV